MKTKAVIKEDQNIVEIHYETEPGKWWLRYQFEVDEISRDTGKKMGIE